MKITFELDVQTTERLGGMLAFLEIPMTATAEIAKEHIQSLSDNLEECFIAEGYVYHDREAARRVAEKLLKLYPGNSEMSLRYHRRGRVVSEDFQKKRLATLITPDHTPFRTQLPRDHVSKIGELLEMLEIPGNQMERTFRATLESEDWHEDWSNWTAGFVYPDMRTAERVAKRIKKRFPDDGADIRLTFMEGPNRATATFPRKSRATRKRHVMKEVAHA